MTPGMISMLLLKLQPRGKALIKTNISIEMLIDSQITDDYYLRIAPRSSVAWKLHTDVGAGVIDPSYRGEINVIIFNHSDSPVTFNQGDRVAQFVIERYHTANIAVVSEFSKNTERGTGGFGSTGK